LRLHIITERDVGLFSLIQQVISNIPWALADDRVPVVHFADGTCYWTPNGYQGRDTVWEYYFEPLDLALPAARVPDHVKSDEQSSVVHLEAAFPERVIAYESGRHESGEAAGQGPAGWIMPAYISGDRDVAARNGEDAVVEYLLLSRCDHLVHNGSSLARTVLLNAPHLMGSADPAAAGLVPVAAGGSALFSSGLGGLAADRAPAGRGQV
jgi:hypothetical protein